MTPAHNALTRNKPGKNVLQNGEPVFVVLRPAGRYLDTMTEKNKLPDIYAYMDFRAYLKDYRLMRLVFDPGFTHTYICYRLGQKNSKSYFANVVNGVKAVTQEFINRFIELLKRVGGEIMI